MAGPYEAGDTKEFTDINDQSSPPNSVSSRSTSARSDRFFEDDMENERGGIRRPNGQRNAHEQQQPLLDGAGQPQQRNHGGAPQDGQQEEQEDCRASIRRCFRCQFPLCVKVLLILSVLLCILAVVALISLIVVYLEIRSNRHDIILSETDQNPQNVFVMANSTYKIDVSPLLFYGVRVSYNLSVNNTENEYTPPSLALVRQSCTKDFVTQSFEGHHENADLFTTAYCLARHWPKGQQGHLNVTTKVGEVRVFYTQSRNDYKTYKNCPSDLQKKVCEKIDHCGNLTLDISEDVYIVLCAEVRNGTTTSFYYELQEQQYDVSANDNTSILTPGDTGGIDVTFNSLVVEMLYPGKCTYLITMDSDSNLNSTTPVIVEALRPRWEEYILLCLCIVLPLVVLVASFAVCFCNAYCCRKVAFRRA